MKYKITITKYDENPDYEKQMEKYNEWYDGNMRGRFPSGPSDGLIPNREIESRALEVFLTEDEYKKVKAEVIKIFE